ncbi:MAG: hypothetical protein JNL22_14215 [Bacteroidales bacterium]|nr:hypothetical protein [Bacteroidales bacterium]
MSFLFITCEKDRDEPAGNNKAELSNIASDSISYTSASFSANVNSTGGHNIVDHGFCYSLETTPDKNDSVKSLGSLAGKGSFNAIIDKLQSNTKYHIRAFITIPTGTIYSQETTFTTLKTGQPLILSDSVFSITPYGATISGTIVSDSGLAVISRGFCWGTVPQPNLSDSTKLSLTNQNHFIENIGNLTNATTYYVRSFATNAAGTSYGNEISFVTNPITPTVNIQNIINITTTYASGGGEVTNDGGAAVTGRGLCWSTEEYPTIFGNHTVDGNGTGSFITDLNGLTPSTTYFVRAYATNSAGTAYSIQKSFVTESIPTIPVVTTSGISNVTTSYGLGGGVVLSDGGSPVITRGVCWSTTQNPNILGLHTTNGSGTGSFTSDLTGLTEGTTYYARAYATNSIGTAYGNQVSFTTANVHTIPTVTTTVISAVTSSTAVSGGDVTATGGDAVTARGVCWSTSQNPTIAGNHTTDGSGSGSFISNLSGLNASTTYYVRAYATNISGTAYGEQMSFVTSPPPVLPTLITASVSSVTTGSAVCGGNITHDGGATVTARGVCWSITQNPTIANAHTTDGTGTGSFSSNITGLNAGTTYYVRAYATNSAGTAYGGQQSFTTSSTTTTPTVTTAAATAITGTTVTCGGNVTSSGGATVTARGVCWSTSQNPTIFGSHTNDGSGTGTFISSLSGLSPSTTYYIRAYATNSAGTAYGSQESFTTTINITVPTVTTAAITEIGANTATGGGNVTASGGATVTVRGVCWSTNQNPTLSDAFTSDGSGTGSFISNITGLNPSTTYYVRAYATNSAGTAYGNQQNFATTAEITCNGFTLTHVAGSVAPVTKTVTYGVTLTDLSGETKCWITQNLGADHQATSATDATEASAGWYWVFNKKQGYRHDGSSRIPDTEWVYPIDENSDWLNISDPCNLLLGSAWRIPTYTEWNNVDITGGWDNYNNTFASELKLHAAGLLNNSDGALLIRGIGGRYWSSSQISNGNGWLLNITNSNSYLDPGDKCHGFTLRCLSDGTTTGSTIPSVITASISNITLNSAMSGGDVTIDGGATVTARGVCWSSSQNPTLSDSYTTDGSGTGPFTSNITGLNPSTTYSVRAYATNGVGTAYGNEESFTTAPAGFVCGNTITINHIAGDVSPVNKTVEYGTVETDLTGGTKCWITQNLGSDRQALSANDDTEASAGWYWQFNRKQGYKHDGTIRTPNTTWIYPIDENNDWILINDPCHILLGSSWRVPTQTEWQNCMTNGNWQNYHDTFISDLHIHAAGLLEDSGNLNARGVAGLYWSQIQYNTGNAYYLALTYELCGVGYEYKYKGYSIRCIK